MTPFETNTEIWMKEFTKKLVQDMINLGVPVENPENEAMMETLSVQKSDDTTYLDLTKSSSAQKLQYF